LLYTLARPSLLTCTFDVKTAGCDSYFRQ